MIPPARVLWKCRRGMREMDILLARFLERGYDALDADGRADFDRLLELSDQDLLRWLCGVGLPDEAALAQLVRHMRSVVARR
jgi:antitoxin CptB